MSPVTVFANTVSSDDGWIIEPIFLNVHVSGVVTLLPSCIVSFSVDLDLDQLMNIPAIQVIIKLPNGQLCPINGGESMFPSDRLQYKYTRSCLPIVSLNQDS